MSFDVSEMAENIAFPGSLIERQSTTVDISNLPLSSPGEIMKLDKTAIKSLVLPEGKREKTYFDDEVPGFGLRTRASGSRRWVVQYNIGRRCRRVGLGAPDN